jgi:hypothetical protein
MTRTTIEADLLLRHPWYPAAWVEGMMSDPWMVEAMAAPCSPESPANVLLDLADILDAPFNTLRSDGEWLRNRLSRGQRAIEQWFKSTIAGQARAELTPADLWALYRITRLVERLIPLPPLPPMVNPDAWMATVLNDDDCVTA